MQLHAQTRLGTIIPLICLFLIVVLGACGGQVSLQTYKGNGYTIGYPQDWTLNNQAQNQGQQATFFAKQDNTARLGIEIDDNPQGASADSVIDLATQNGNTAAKLKDIQQHQISATAQFAGETWLQRAFDGTNAQGVKVTLVYLLANHKAGSTMKIFVIVFAATANSFDQANTDFFQPMTKSFAFTS